MLKNYNFNSMLSGCHAVMDRLIDDGADPEELYKSSNVADCILTIGEHYAKSSGSDEMTARAEEIKSHEHDIAETLGYVLELVDNDMGADSEATKKYNSIIGVLHDHIGRLQDADVDISISHEIDQCIESIAKVYVTDEDQVDIYDKTNDHDWADALTFLLDNLGGYDTAPDMPIAIKITKTPDKLTYHVGDNVDYTGIEVRAIGKNGKWWKNKNYPGGIIPIEELKFPDTIITADVDWTAERNLVYDAGTYLGTSGGRRFLKSYDGKAIGIFSINRSGSRWTGPVLISTKIDSVKYNQGSPQPRDTVQYLGITWRGNSDYHLGSASYDTPLTVFDSKVTEDIEGLMIRALQESGVKLLPIDDRNINVEWEYSENNFVDNFDISIE